MKILLDDINMDTSIQCRAIINVETVSEYAEAMKDGATFPPVILFGDYIGDGWHRIMAAKQAGLKEIEADYREGGRADALKFALGANASNGLRRTNADKRRSVEIALQEFGNLSSRAIADLCGVNPQTVINIRPEVSNLDNATRTTSDGRQYPAKRMPKRPATFETPEEEEAFYENATKQEQKEVKQPEKMRPIGPPADGMQFARIAMMNLEQIKTNDIERLEAFTVVKDWIIKHEN